MPGQSTDRLHIMQIHILVSILRIVQVIYEFDLKGALHKKLHILISGAAVALIFLIFHNDLFGYDRYVPEGRKNRLCPRIIIIKITEKERLIASHHPPYRIFIQEKHQNTAAGNNHISDLHYDQPDQNGVGLFKGVIQCRGSRGNPS